METINWSDFSKVDMRVGTIVSVNDFPEVRNPAYKLEIDFGPEIGINISTNNDGLQERRSYRETDCSSS